MAPTKNPGNKHVPAHSRPVESPSGIPACIPLIKADSDEAARVYREVFLADEPTTHTRSPDPARFLHYAKLYTRFLAGKNLSFCSPG